VKVMTAGDCWIYDVFFLWFYQLSLCPVCCHRQFDQVLWTCHIVEFSNTDCGSYL
jgi:hypothetical protein